jgi:hypothetical protein|uniref:hypothetical protein n=1 Tax=Haloprofundus sp. MHR1 TaxID=2572921 RepID=UPI001F40D4F0|nr:hypothetical protein [Haloprofundus sp. MHR1]
MPSYKLIPTPHDDLDTEDVEDRVAQLSARESNADLGRGTLPETLDSVATDVFWFEYAIEREFEYETLGGEHETKILEKHPVVFLGGDFVAIGNCNKEVENELQEFLETNFVPGYSLETLNFEESTLQQIIEQAPDIVKADLNPTQTSEPEQISGRDRRSLKATDFWDRYEGEPVSKVKVKLPNEGTEITVGFDKRGIVILYEQSLTMREQVEALQYVADNVLSRFIDPHYQTTLLGE